MQKRSVAAPDAPAAPGGYAVVVAGIFDERWLVEIEAVAAA